MKHHFPGPLSDHGKSIMRRLGYGEHVGHSGQLSYAKRYGVDLYPRFHAYVEDIDGGLQVNLHLDQKKASYASGPAHGGEYDGPLIEAEMARIARFVEGLGAPASPAAPAAPSPAPKASGSSFWD
jgi:hypothetical protein